MLKMYIDNEEVVSNNKFTIKEEILSPSSTILNNVYPKTWEQDKDYISRFFYPMDYSKFLLQNYTHILPEEGLTATISNGSQLTGVDTNKEQELLNVLGDTEQETLSGKNKIDTKATITQATGLTVTRQNNGQLLVNGTNSSMVYPEVVLMTGLNIPAGTYTFSVKDNSGNNYSGDFYYTINGTSTYKYKGTGNLQITTSVPITALKYFLYFPAKTYTNTIISLQLEQGTSVTDYEPYCGGVPSPNPSYPQNINVVTGNQVVDVHGKNMFNIQSLIKGRVDNGNIGYESGTTVLTKNSDSFSFTTNANWRGVATGFIKVEPNTYYVFSSLTSLNANNQPVMFAFYDINKTFIQNGAVYHIDDKTRRTLTTSTTQYMRVSFQINPYGTLEIDHPQLEKGNQATSYEPYKGNTYEVNLGDIELCKIGNYQDKIYKSGDTWYLHKEIGKVVYNGSEDFSYESIGGFDVFEKTISDMLTQNAGVGYSNYYRAKELQETPTSGHVRFGWSNKKLYFYNETSLFSGSIANFKTWLGTHNTIVYYVLATPTETEITNEDLINELESIKLINGYNDVSITSGDLPGSLTIHYNYITEQHITDTIFNGIVKNTSDISLNPRHPKYCSLEVLDYKTLLSEGDTLDFVIYNKTILEAIDMVIDAVESYGFKKGNINILNGDDVIGTYSTDNKTAYDVLQYLADISGAKWNCRQEDDAMYIDFYDPTLLPKGKQIDYESQWWCENNVVDLSFNYGTRDYRNKQVIISDEVYADIDYNENKVGDAYTRDFILSNPIASIKQITVNGEEVSVATDTEKDIGVYADFYYQVGGDTVSSNDANDPYGFGNVIEITYTPIIKGREVIQNDDEIDRINDQLEVNGIISRYEERNDETDTNKLLAIGETYLKYKGEAEITITLKTFNNDIYQVGQMVYFNAPIQELAKDYLVKSKEIEVISKDGDLGNVFYTYELSSSFNSERAVNWFDNQRSKTEGNIGEGEYISRNIDISSITKIIWSGYECEEIETMTGDNIISAPLDAPINN